MTRNVAFIYHDSLTKNVMGKGHPLQPVRLRRTYELLQSYAAFSKNSSTVVEPRKAILEELLTFYAGEYIELV